MLLLFVLFFLLTNTQSEYITQLTSGDGVCEKTTTRVVIYTAYKTQASYVCSGRNCGYFYYIVSSKQSRSERVVTPVCCDGFYELENRCMRNSTDDGSTDGQTSLSRQSDSSSSSAVIGMSVVLVTIVITVIIAIGYYMYRKKPTFMSRKSSSTSQTPVYVEPNKIIPEYLDFDTSPKSQNKSNATASPNKTREINLTQVEEIYDECSGEQEEDKHKNSDKKSLTHFKRLVSEKVEKFSSSVRQVPTWTKTMLGPKDSTASTTAMVGQDSFKINNNRMRSAKPQILSKTGTLSRKQNADVSEFNLTDNLAYGVSKKMNNVSIQSLAKRKKSSTKNPYSSEPKGSPRKESKDKRNTNESVQYDDIELYADIAD